MFAMTGDAGGSIELSSCQGFSMTAVIIFPDNVFVAWTACFGYILLKYFRLGITARQQQMAAVTIVATGGLIIAGKQGLAMNAFFKVFHRRGNTNFIKADWAIFSMTFAAGIGQIYRERP